MPFPPYRSATLYPFAFATDVGRIVDQQFSSHDPTTVVGVSNGTANRRFRPGVTGDTFAFGGTFDALGVHEVLIADWQPDDTRGKAYIPSQSVTATVPMSSSNSGGTLGTPAVNLAMYFYDVNPSNLNDNPDLIEFISTGGFVNVPADVLGIPQITDVNMSGFLPEHTFERNRSLAVIIGGAFRSPNGTVGGNTSTFRCEYDEGCLFTFQAIGARVRIEDSATGASLETSSKTTKVLKLGTGQSVGASEQERVVDYFRTGQSSSVGSGLEVKTFIKKLIDGFSARVTGSESTKILKNIPATGSGSGDDFLKVSKSMASQAVTAAVAAKLAEFSRSATGSATGIGVSSRVVTFVRDADGHAKGIADPRNIRISVPISSLVPQDGGGSTTYIRPVLIFDD